MEIRNNGRPYSPWPIERPEDKNGDKDAKGNKDKDTKETKETKGKTLLENIKDAFEKSPVGEEYKRAQDLIKNSPKI